MLSVVFLGFAWLPSSAQALDPELRKPYQLEVVLHLSKQRLLTEVFREQLVRELSDSLQEAFGDLARVKVVSQHPRLADVLSKGLGRALDEWNERSEIKTHFVLIDYAGEYYQIQARQHDGLTGMASPVVREERTIARTLVAKTAALMVAQDFGLVGTLRLPLKPQEPVKVDLRGSSLGVPLNSWVKVGEVFQVVEIPEHPGPKGPLPGRPLSRTYLQVIQAPGEVGPECVCRLYRPNQATLGPPPRGMGYRCLKIATGKYPLRVQLLQDNNDKPPSALDGAPHAVVRSLGFKDVEQSLRVDPDGLVDSSLQGQLFNHLAFLTVKLDGREVDVPLALVSDQVMPLLLKFSSNREAEDFRFRLDRWSRDVTESMKVQIFLFDEIRDLDKKGQRAQQFARVKEAIRRSQIEVRQLRSDGEELRKEAVRLKLSPANLTDLAAAEQRIKKIQDGEQELQTYLAQLEQNEKQENDPIRKKQLDEVERARLLVKQAEVSQALEIYDRVLDQGLNSDQIKSERDRLKKLWEPKSDKHALARKFIYEAWTQKLDVGELTNRLAEAGKALAECKRAGDLFGPRKFLDLTVEHASRLQEELSRLNAGNLEDEMQIKAIQDINSKLQKLAQDAEEYLRKKLEEKK